MLHRRLTRVDIVCTVAYVRHRHRGGVGCRQARKRTQIDARTTATAGTVIAAASRSGVATIQLHASVEGRI